VAAQGCEVGKGHAGRDDRAIARHTRSPTTTTDAAYPSSLGVHRAHGAAKVDWVARGRHGSDGLPALRRPKYDASRRALIAVSERLTLHIAKV
jgi:hypothetical protein